MLGIITYCPTLYYITFIHLVGIRISRSFIQSDLDWETTLKLQSSKKPPVYTFSAK